MDENNFMKYPLKNFFKSLDEQGKVEILSPEEHYEVTKEIEDSIKKFSREYGPREHEPRKFRKAC